MASNNGSNVSTPKPKPKPKPKLPKPTICSTFDEIDEYWKSKNKRIGSFGVGKNNNPNVICTICYFDCIENDKGIQIQFLRRSNVNHWDFQHKELYEKYVKNYNKKKNIIYFVLNETGNILTGDIKSKNDIIEIIKSLPQKKITYPKLDSFVVNKSITNEANTNKNQSTSDKNEMEEDLDDVDIDIDNNSNNNNIRKRPISVLESDEFEVEEPSNKKRKLNDNVGQGNNVIKGVQYPPLPAMDSNTNEWMKYFGTFLPAMRDDITFKFKALTKQLETYEDRIAKEVRKMKKKILNTKVCNIKRDCMVNHYNDCLIIYGGMGFNYAKNPNNILTKIGFCTVCCIAPIITKDQTSTFAKNGKETGEWFDSKDSATREQWRELQKYIMVLDYHFFDEKGSVKHRENLLKSKGRITTKKAMAFCSMSRAFARVLSLGIGYTNYEAFLEDYHHGGVMIGDHYHSRKFGDTLLTYFYDDRINQIADDVHIILPATGCPSPFATTTDKSTDAAGTHEDQIIGYIKNGVKTYAEIGIKHISNKKDDEKTHATKKGLSLSLIDSLEKVRLKKERTMRCGWASISNDGEYIVKG